MKCVRVTQLVETEDLGDHEDRHNLPAGGDGRGSQQVYPISASAKDAEAALDNFHFNVPIGCLDDFDFEVIELAQLKEGER